MESFQDRFIKKLQEKAPNSHCPICGVSEWQIQPWTYYVREHVKTSYQEAWGYAMPSAVMVCLNCGNTHFMNLLVHGDEFKGDL